MLTLGLDLSGSKGTLGLAENDRIKAEASFDMRMKALSEVLPAMAFILERHGYAIGDVDLFACATGPGNWTGIRIGVSLVKSMAHALGKPVAGVCALDVLACHFKFTDMAVYPLIDAARGRVYLARYDCGGPVPRRVSEYDLQNIERVVSGLQKPSILAGSGVMRYQDRVIDILGPDCQIAPSSTSWIRGGHLALEGYARFQDHGPDDPHALRPLYMQKSDAEMNWEAKSGANQR